MVSFRSAGLFALAALLCGCTSDPFSCDNGIEDGVETSVDCGGALCPPCQVGLGCLVPGDCVSGRCLAGVCALPATCGDMVRDGAETDVDCGGGVCPRCDVNQRCALDRDCIFNLCDDGRCAPAPTCTDGKRNGSETDIDCGGGTCTTCDDGAMCLVDGDCTTMHCVAGVCLGEPCADGTQDDDETDVDCGGGTCPQCPVGYHCLDDSDCLSTLCQDGMCIPLAQLCPGGYQQDVNTMLCICDPKTCGSCCDVDEGNLCGLAQMYNGNNCGSHGQTCFKCDISLNQNCEHGLTTDYCATACEAQPCNGGCCSGKQNKMLHFCLTGDEDWACGGDGNHCSVCAIDQHCVNKICVPFGNADGGI